MLVLALIDWSFSYVAKPRSVLILGSNQKRFGTLFDRISIQDAL